MSGVDNISSKQMQATFRARLTLREMVGKAGIGGLGMDKEYTHVFVDSWIYTFMFSFMFVSISVFIYIYLFNILYVLYIYIFVHVYSFIYLFIHLWIGPHNVYNQLYIYIGWISEKVLSSQDYEFSCVQDWNWPKHVFLYKSQFFFKFGLNNVYSEKKTMVLLETFMFLEWYVTLGAKNHFWTCSSVPSIDLPSLKLTVRPWK